MYKLSDYYFNAKIFLQTNLLNTRRLSVLMFYVTDYCNSKCEHCRIWEKNPNVEFPFEKFVEVLNSKSVTKKTKIGLEGGEFIFHKEREEMLEYLTDEGYNYEMLTNGLYRTRTVELVRKYKIPKLFISLDGDREGYEKMRGLDAYDKVIELIDEIHHETEISLMYTITAWNEVKDLEHVIGVAKKYGLDLRVGIYNNIKFFDTVKEAHTDFDYEGVDLSDFDENSAYLRLYKDFISGAVVLPCYSIRQQVVILPDGSVPICQLKGDVSLGHVCERSFADIWDDPKTIAIQKKNTWCNGCWINFHRKFEIALFQKLRYVPRTILKRFVGDYKLGSDFY